MDLPIEKIIESVRKTRDLTLPYFGNIEAKKYKSAEYADAVTEIDEQVETQLKNDLNTLLPDIPFVGEEYGGNREDETFWLSDPIDGTGHFIRGIPFCSTMLALVHKGEVLFSIIYDFVNNDVYHAQLGKGAFKNNEKISVSERSCKQAYLHVETKINSAKNQQLYSAIRNKANILQTASAGYEFILVATGKTDGRIVFDGYGRDYDFAPGSLLVKEAGGVVRNFKSDSYDYTNLNFIAANKEIYAELIESDESIERLM